MSGYNLPENVDTTYADDADNPDVELHQSHHDKIHDIVNKFDKDADPDNGDVLVWEESTSLYKPQPIDTDGVVGPTGPAGADGVGFIHRGLWDAGTAYHVYTANTPDAYELVSWQGNTYVALSSQTGAVPPDPADAPSAAWDVFAEKGDDGTPGIDGSDGQSIQGPPGVAGPSAEALGQPHTINGTETFDTSLYTGVQLVLGGNSVIHVIDSLANPFTMMTFRIVMGSGGPYTCEFVDVPDGSWPSTNNVTPGDGPDFSGLAAGDELVVGVEQMNGDFRGYVPGGSGGGMTPPPPGYPTLGVEQFVTAAVRTHVVVPVGGTSASWTGLGTAVQVGNKRGGMVWVAVTRQGATDPEVPSLQGFGASGWQVAQSQLEGTGDLRRRITLFVSREAVSGAATTGTVTVTGAVAAEYTSCIVNGVRTTDDVPPTWLDLMVSSAAGQQHGDGGENTATMHCPLASPADAANRGIVGVMGNQSSGTIVPEAGWTQVGIAPSTLNPNSILWVIWKSSAFDTTPSATFTGPVDNNNPWCAVGAEMEQG